MESKKSLVQKISSDFILNFIASAVVTAVMQLLMYPIISRKLGNVKYGDFLTIIGIVNTVSAVVGTTLNNVRLIRETDYLDNNIRGDFNFLLVLMSALAVIVSVPIFLIFKLAFIEVFFVEILMILMSIRGYWSVAYRLKLDYKKILISNLILSGGYLVGCRIFLMLKSWVLPFLLGEILVLVYLFFTTDLRTENYGKTVFFGKIVKDVVCIGCSTLSANVLVYLDRLVLYPLLGGEAVTTYTVASVGGKFLGIVATPLAGVLLSYYSQPGFIMGRKRFWKITSITIIISSIGLAVIIPISPYIIQRLYPLVYDNAMPFVPLACVAGIMALICNFIQPSVLKITPTKWQLLKEIIYGLTYIGLGYFMLSQFGMIGFCIANIIALAIKMIILVALGQVYCSKE